jgi:hypothetical protein
VICRRAALGTLAVLAIVVPGAQAAYPGVNGPLVFQSSRDGDNEIYLLNPDGSGVTKLTDNVAGDLNPVWSPDGAKIAFQSNRDGDADVWVMNADGTAQTALTDDPGFDGQPTWSPDGTRIAFTSARDGDDEIYSMNGDGSDETQLTVNTATDEDPAWGPNTPCQPPCGGPDLIAFTTDRDGNEEIYLMGEDGSGPSNYTVSSGADREPSWRVSGGSSEIAFASNRGSPPGDPDFDILTGRLASPIATGPTDEVAPAFSPDGHRIAFERDEGNREIYVVTLDSSSSPINVTNAATNERSPDWRPEAGSFPQVRPRGATPLRVPLAPAFAPCTAPNRTHGPPLAFGSCAPPVPLSLNITVGTPDHLGAVANSIMSVRLDVRPGTPGPPEDSDIAISAFFSDIRCRQVIATCGSANGAGGSDYTGELIVELPVAITDSLSSSVPGGGADRATTTESPLEMTMSCASSTATTTGATCATATTVNALAPLAVQDSKRAIWQLGQIIARDGGPDGAAGTADNSVFAKQAVFVP